jgi:HAD superfamily hydrolase (TIGR01509 family)
MAVPDIEAIVFDCFGVLYTDLRQSFLSLVPTQRRQELQDVFTRNNYGYMDRDEYLRAVSDITELEVEEVKDYFVHEHKLNTQLMSYIKNDLKPKYRLALLSNIGHDWIQDFFTTHDLHDLFEVVVLSGDVGIAKPSPQIFELTADRLNLSPSQCLMIDDLAENCEGAEIAGMHSIQFHDTDLFIQDCKKLLT